jgi:hypothetical protein
MARDEESNGNGNGSSGKSGRQDSSLSARRARLRSLAKQALPPDPYSKKPEGTQEDAPSLELEFLDKTQGQPAGAVPAPHTPATEPWAADATGTPAQDPNIKPKPLPQGYQALSSDKYPAMPQEYQKTPVSPIAPTPAGFGGDPQQRAPMPGGFGGEQQQQGAMPGGFAGEQQQQTPMGMPFGQEHSMPNMPAADPGFSFSEPSFGTLPADPDQSFESFMQGPAESPSSFMTNPVADPTPPSGFPMGTPDPNFGQQEAPVAAAETTAPATPQSQAVEQSYLQHSPSEKDFTSKLDLDYGDLEDEVPPAPEPEPQPEPFSPLRQTHTQSQTQTQVISTMPLEPESSPVQSQATEPEPIAADDDMNAWEFNNKSKRKENAWSVEEETPANPEVAEVPQVPEQAEIVAEAPAAEVVNEEVLEEQPKEQAPVQKKRSRKKAEPEPEEVEKEPEIKPVDGESQDEDKVISVWKKAIDDEEARVKSKAASDLANKKGDDEETPSKTDPSSKDANRTAEAAPPVVQVPVELLTKTQAEALEMLTSIDQALGICAMNLSSMQTASNEQTDVLKNLRETLQNQTFFELGLNLNTLMESMSAALEPMKAVGELVPAIDQLVSAMVSNEEKEQKTRMSPDKLVMGLADQLGAGQIDPWTFKCAYMALFPDEHPADLLHRLVELLGTQKVSGELFRSAYDAVQAAEPVRVNASGEVIKEVIKEVIVEVVKEVEVEVVKVVPDEEVVRELEDLKRAHEDMRLMLDDKDSDLGRRFEEREREFSSRLEDRESELTKRLEERETEYAELLAAKEHEIQETQEMLHSRFEEFNSRYEEMVETVNQRDEELKVKDDEVMRRESEITQLKAQLDELKESFKDTVENLQKQLTSSQKAAHEANMQAQAISQQRAPVPQPEESPKPQGSFFDQDSSKQQQSQTQAPNAFGGGDGGAARPLFQHQVDTFNSMSKMPKEQAPPTVFGGPPTPGAPPTPPDSFGGGAPPTGPIPETSTQAVPKPPQPTPGMSPMNGSGSYGSGVRAQVFEVIVRQALAGAPWREICAGPMSVNNISPEEVEGEVKRREALLKK